MCRYGFVLFSSCDIFVRFFCCCCCVFLKWARGRWGGGGGGGGGIDMIQINKDDNQIRTDHQSEYLPSKRARLGVGLKSEPILLQVARVNRNNEANSQARQFPREMLHTKQKLTTVHCTQGADSHSSVRSHRILRQVSRFWGEHDVDCRPRPHQRIADAITSRKKVKIPTDSC